MMTNRAKLMVGLMLVAGLATSAKADQAGKVTQITGEVRIVRSANKPETLKVYEPVFEGDQLETGMDGRVKVLLTDDSVITLTPGTKLKIRQQTFSRTEAKRESFFDLFQGRIRAAVARYSSNYTNSFKVKTPTAVAGVRGSIEVVGTGGGQDFMACVEGPCTYGPAGNEKTLQSGQISFMQGGVPGEPHTPTPEEQAGLINSTIFANYGGNNGSGMPGSDGTNVGGGDFGGEQKPLNLVIQITKDTPHLDLEPGGAGLGRAKVRISVPFKP